MSKFKVGDKVECNTHGWDWHQIRITKLPRRDGSQFSNYCEVENKEGNIGLLPERDLEFIDEKPSPIRTVTTTEIVAGTYGKVRIGTLVEGKALIDVVSLTKAIDVRESGEILLKLADALDNGAKVVAK